MNHQPVLSAENPTIAVVIPAYKAAAHIRDVLTHIPDWVRHIVVVDDCSPDETREIVRQWPDPRVHLVAHEENQGVGGAVLSGYHEAVSLGADIIVKMDSDDQMDPNYMLPLISPIVKGDADYTKGNRFLHSRQLQTMPKIRFFGNIGLSFLTKLASGYWNIFDPTNGYTAIHASLIPLLSEGAIARRYFFETSMLIELGFLRAVIRDVFIPARYGNETSSLSEKQVLREFPPLLLKAFLRRLWVQYFIRDFSIVSLDLVLGAAMTAFGFIWGIWHWIYYYFQEMTTPAGTVMIAVLPIILGIQLIIQAVTLDVQNVPAYPIQSPGRILTHFSSREGQ